MPHNLIVQSRSHNESCPADQDKQALLRARMSGDAMTIHRVGIVIHAGVQALDVAGPLDAFGEANKFLPSGERYEVVLIAVSRDPIRASNNMQMMADVTFAEADEPFDILLVAGGPSLPRGEPDQALVEYLRQASRTASLYGSVCTGAFPSVMPDYSTAIASRPIGRSPGNWLSDSRPLVSSPMRSTSKTGSW
jgi:hypothetical protein